MSRSSFFALAFANYVEMQDDFKQSFADWLKVKRTRFVTLTQKISLFCFLQARTEIWK